MNISRIHSMILLVCTIAIASFYASDVYDINIVGCASFLTLLASSFYIYGLIDGITTQISHVHKRKSERSVKSFNHNKKNNMKRHPFFYDSNAVNSGGGHVSAYSQDYLKENPNKGEPEQLPQSPFGPGIDGSKQISPPPGSVPHQNHPESKISSDLSSSGEDLQSRRSSEAGLFERLSIPKGSVKVMMGSIEVQSAEVGCIFSIDLTGGISFKFKGVDVSFEQANEICRSVNFTLPIDQVIDQLLAYELKTSYLQQCPVPLLQNESEWNNFMRLVEEKQPRNILEIGSFFGGSMWCFLKAIKKIDLFISMDLPVPSTDGRYAQMMQCRQQWPSWMAASNVGQFHDITGSSFSQENVDRAKAIVANNGIDMLFIDGSHEYEDAKKDFINFAHLVNPGGMIVFHDITGIEPIRRLWNEVKIARRVTEIKDGQHEGWGIGVIHM